LRTCTCLPIINGRGDEVLPPAPGPACRERISYGVGGSGLAGHRVLQSPRCRATVRQRQNRCRVSSRPARRKAEITGYAAQVARIRETGDLSFWYQPRVTVDRVRGPDDVARFYLLLEPAGRAIFRRVIVGRKRLPDVGAHERTWGFVDLVACRPEAVANELAPETDETRTRGVRVAPPARPAGEAGYAIVEHAGHTHLVYVLELPEAPGPVQHELGIHRAMSMIVAVRNPEGAAPPATGLPPGRRAHYPEQLQKALGTRRFAPLDSPKFLDHPGTELVLIAASGDPLRELGIDIPKCRETPEPTDLLSRLGAEPGAHPLGPLLEGRWE
jgi:hypothetical protein